MTPDPRSPVVSPTAGWRRYLVAGGLYLLVSLAMWWHVWTARPSAVMTCGCTDAGRAVWYLEWSAYAVSHGHNLLHSNWLFHPAGFNLLTDTSIPAVGLAMTPVTLLFGPVVGVNVVDTLIPVLTGLAMFWLLQRWVTWTPAAFVGGLVYGFSAFVIVQLAFGWLNLAFVGLLPLMVACVDELLVRQRARPVRVGLALGLLVAVEVFVSAEMVLIVVVSGVVTVVMLGLYAAGRDATDLRRRLPYAVKGTAAAAGVALVLLAYPVWLFVSGPGHLSGELWSTNVPGDLGNIAGNFWSHLGVWGPLNARQLAQEAPVLGGYRGAPLPSSSFLGIGWLAVMVAGVVWWRRDRRLWLFGGLGLVAAVISLRVGGGSWGPWALVYHLPLFRDAVQSRFSAVVDLCAAVILAIVVDRVRSAGARSSGSGASASPGRAAPAGWLAGRRWSGVVSALVALAVAAVAIAPEAAALAPNLPLTVQPVIVPRWFVDVAPASPSRSGGARLSLRHRRLAVIDSLAGDRPDVLRHARGRRPDRHRGPSRSRSGRVLGSPSCLGAIVGAAGRVGGQPGVGEAGVTRLGGDHGGGAGRLRTDDLSDRSGHHLRGGVLHCGVGFRPLPAVGRLGVVATRRWPRDELMQRGSVPGTVQYAPIDATAASARRWLSVPGARRSAAVRWT